MQSAPHNACPYCRSHPRPLPDLCRAHRNGVLHLQQLLPYSSSLWVGNVSHTPPHHAKRLQKARITAPREQTRASCSAALLKRLLPDSEAAIGNGWEGTVPVSQIPPRMCGHMDWKCRLQTAAPATTATPHTSTNNTTGRACLGEGEDVDDVGSCRAVVPPTLPIGEVVVCVVQYQPGTRLAAQSRGPLHLRLSHKHACAAYKQWFL